MDCDAVVLDNLNGHPLPYRWPKQGAVALENGKG